MLINSQLCQKVLSLFYREELPNKFYVTCQAKNINFLYSKRLHFIEIKYVFNFAYKK